MIFAPIFIGYDTVLEESSYLHEIEGKEKQPESLVQVIKARKFLKKRYGRIYIQFHEPISLKGASVAIRHTDSRIWDPKSLTFSVEI